MQLKKTVAQLSPDTLKGKRVFVRVDFNVPQADDGSITDDSRIRAALPTVQLLLKAGARVLLASHLGRPKGESEKLSLKPIAKRLSELLGTAVEQLPDCIGPEVASAVAKLKDGQVCLLENVRFYPEEEKNDPEFAKKLAANADIYVNDAFGTAHRAHASTAGVARYLKPAVAGLLMDNELKALSGVLDDPVRPFATVIGGSKVSTKIGVLQNLIERVDLLVIGGAMAFTFLKAQGKEVGKSLVENDRLEFCQELLVTAKSKGARVLLPADVVCAPKLEYLAPISIHDADKIPADQMGLDLGPKTVQAIGEALSPCRTILWNGPLGAFETVGFERATYALVDELKRLTAEGAKTVIGGGDSVAAIEALGVSPAAFTHVSTGGGASLEFLEGLELPGVACLNPAQSVGSRS